MKLPPSKVLLGVLLANIFGMGVLGVSTYIVEQGGNKGVLVASNFVLIPLMMGLICSYFWDGELHRTGQYIRYTILTTLTAILLSSFFLMEGVICLFIVFPILFGFTISGVMLGRTIISRNRKSSLHVAPLFLLLLVGESMAPPKYHDSVVDEVTVNAPPSEVWKHLPAFTPITSPKPFWLFDVGLARPLRADVEGTYLGAWRRCEFTNNLVFEEVITEYKENEALGFTVVKQPKDPEIFDHVTIERGRMALRDNGDGTTTIVGTTWYQLHAFPAWYYKLWADSIGRAVHFQVMNHIKLLSENSPQKLVNGAPPIL